MRSETLRLQHEQNVMKEKIRENGEKWLKEEAEMMEKMQAEAMANMKTENVANVWTDDEPYRGIWAIAPVP